MHAGTRDMPAWLVCVFGVTNVTQGLLGYLVARLLVRSGRRYLAYLQVVSGYFAMFFVLVHGWDGEGYQRFFSPTRADFVGWSGDWQAWLTSTVALTLLVMGAVLVPLLLALMVGWLREAHRLAGLDPAPGRARLCAVWLATIFVAALGPAVGCALLLSALGQVGGGLTSLALLAAVYAPHGPVHRLHRMLRLPATPGPASPGRRGGAARARPAAPAASAGAAAGSVASPASRARP
jgi:hypothetical protein